MAYQSNESGQDEIYVRPFPDVDQGRWQISTGGGTRPLWARSGKELFYLGPSGAVMSASVEGESTFRAGRPTRLFEERYLTLWFLDRNRRFRGRLEIRTPPGI